MVGGVLLETGGNGAEVFDPVEEALDAIAFALEEGTERSDQICMKLTWRGDRQTCSGMSAIAGR